MDPWVSSDTGSLVDEVWLTGNRVLFLTRSLLFPTTASLAAAVVLVGDGVGLDAAAVVEDEGDVLTLCLRLGTLALVGGEAAVLVLEGPSVKD